MSDTQPDDNGKALASLCRKHQVVCDHVKAVAKGFKPGYYLYGNGGSGKSYTVLRQLDELNAPYQLYNSRMTAKGLFLTLRGAPDLIHVLEDMERLTKDADAQGVLRSALWAQPGHDRIVTWTTATEGAQRFAFRGGLILISNRPLADMPELRALATRIEVHQFEVTEAELAALMWDLAGKGYNKSGQVVIAPKECLRVTEHLLQECRRAGCPLDLRLQQKSFQTFLQWESDWSDSHWEDLVAASVREATHQFQHEVNTAPREERKANRRNILREILSQTSDAGEQEERYKDRTGFSRADFFRRKRELESKEFDSEEPNGSS